MDNNKHTCNYPLADRKGSGGYKVRKKRKMEKNDMTSNKFSYFFTSNSKILIVNDLWHGKEFPAGTCI